MPIRSQLLKGILEGCILAIIKKSPVYGYELSEKLRQSGLDNIREGTIYPVLLRLQRNGLIKSETRPSDYGPNRKYYFLTDHGETALTNIQNEWNEIVPPVTKLLKEEQNNVENEASNNRE